MPLTGSDEETSRIMAQKRAAAAAQARPNDGIESASFTPFAPARTALEALDNAVAGYTPDGDLVCVPAPPGQAQELLARAIKGEPGVGIYLHTVNTTDVAIPVVIGSGENSLFELDASHCLPANRLDYDLTPDGLEPLPIGRFKGAKSGYAVTCFMRWGWIRTQAQIDYGKPTVDLGLDLPLRKAKRAAEDAAKAKAILAPFVPKPEAPATDMESAIYAASIAIGKTAATLAAATLELDARLHDPARLKGGTFTPKGDVWTLDETLSGTAMACSMTLEEAFALWQTEKAKTAGTPKGSAGGFSETSSPGGSGGGMKG